MWPSAAEAFLRGLFATAVARAAPAQQMAAYLPPPPRHGRTLVLGAGKAAGAMAAAVDALWPASAALAGLVVTAYGHIPLGYNAGRIEVMEAAHPVPDAASQHAAERMLALTEGLTADDLVLCLLSGGGSSLLTLPAPGLALADKQSIYRDLLASGARIGEMNCVRKHLSAIKGGWLAAHCAPARLLSLLVSDIPGDDPQWIASGPTLADTSTCADALTVLQRYAIPIPAWVQEGLASGRWETPKPGATCFARATLEVIATPQQSLEAAAAQVRAAGLAAYILSDAIEGESRDVGRVHAAIARAVARRGQPFARPCVILSGGETTVSLRHPKPGQGGRAGEFLLACALALEGEVGVYALAADTDGIDGASSAAGAWVGPESLARAAAQGLDAQAYLERHDSHGFFAALGQLVHTGPTLTNVNDFRAILVA